VSGFAYASHDRTLRVGSISLAIPLESYFLLQETSSNCSDKPFCWDSAQKVAGSSCRTLQMKQDQDAFSTTHSSIDERWMPPKKRWGRKESSTSGKSCLSAHSAGFNVFKNCSNDVNAQGQGGEGLSTGVQTVLGSRPSMPSTKSNGQSSLSDSESFSRVCVICQIADREALFTPCGHFRFCLKCAWRQCLESNRCPSCGSAIKKVQRVFT
jgi:hypothetical protein